MILTNEQLLEVYYQIDGNHHNLGRKDFVNLRDTITDLQAQLYSLQAGDEQRARDISRLTIERDDARAQLAASREKEQKLIEHFEKRIETEVSKVAQLLRERQAERAAVLARVEELVKEHFGYVPRSLIVLTESTDRLALDRYVEEKMQEARLAEAVSWNTHARSDRHLAQSWADARLAQLRAVPAEGEK